MASLLSFLYLKRHSENQVCLKSVSLSYPKKKKKFLTTMMKKVCTSQNNDDFLQEDYISERVFGKLG